MNWIKKFNRNRWTLAFFTESELSKILAGDFRNVHLMKYSDKTRWFADPFILSINNKTITVLVEELSYDSNKGRLAKLTVDTESWELKDMKVFLELDTHLSFPMIYRENENTYIIPENSASGKCIVYRYDERHDDVEPIGIICEDPLTDATICEFNDELFVFATSIPNQNGNKLLIYKLDNNFKANKLQEVGFSSNIARNAGNPFYWGEDLIRPAQDCNGDYGKKVILQRIDFDKENKTFSFQNVGEISPFDYRYQKGLHTLNKFGDMFVVDMRGYLYPHIGRIIRPLINILHKIGI